MSWQGLTISGAFNLLQWFFFHLSVFPTMLLSWFIMVCNLCRLIVMLKIHIGRLTNGRDFLQTANY